MKKRSHSLWLLALLAGVMWSSTQLSAQQTAPPADQQSPSQPAAQEPTQQQPPAQPPAQSGQAADPQAQSQQQDQVFTGMIAKMNGKYVLQDSSGTTFDIDQQNLAKKYEGKQVRIKGTLDPDGKTIHVK